MSKRNKDFGCGFAILILLLISMILLILPLAILGLSVYLVYYVSKNKQSIKEKYKLPDRWYGNPVLYSVIVMFVATGLSVKAYGSILSSDTPTSNTIVEQQSENKEAVVEQQVESKETMVKDEPIEEVESSNTFVEAKVIEVTDGDTIKVSVNGSESKLRLIGVDTPETVHPNKGVEFFGKEASDFTKEKLTNQTVYLQKDVSDTDRYGRLLRYVWLARPLTNEPTDDEIKTNMFNAILVSNGYAHASTYQPDSKYSNLFSTLQNEASTNNIGLWNKEKENEFKQVANDQSTHNSNTGNNAFGKNYNADTTQGVIKGNSKSMIYHVPGGASYNKISNSNVVYFNSEEEAQAAGYRKAKR